MATVKRKTAPAFKMNVATEYQGYPSPADRLVIDYICTGVSVTPYETMLGLLWAGGLPRPGSTVEVGPPGWVAAGIELSHTDQEGTVNASVTCMRDPLELPVEIHYQSSHVTEAVWKDVKTSKPPMNSAGDLYDPPLDRARGRLRMEIVKRYSVSTWTEILNNIVGVIDHQNAGTFLDSAFTRGTCYLSDVRAVLTQEPYWHYVVTYQVEIENSTDYENFQARVLDAGPRYNDTNGKPISCGDGYGHLHGGIGLLDGSGGKGSVDSPKWNTFDIIPFANFNLLRI
jgi:hypothetical protein